MQYPKANRRIERDGTARVEGGKKAERKKFTGKQEITDRNGITLV